MKQAAAVGLVVGMLVLGAAAAAAAQRPPADGSGGTAPPPDHRTTPSVSASIDPNQPQVGYQGVLPGNQAQTVSGGGSKSSGGQCSGLSYTAAVAQYGDRVVSAWLHGSTYFAYGPYMLPEVGETPAPGRVGNYYSMYFVMCGSAPKAFGYVYPQATAPVSSVDARSAAQTAAGDIPLPGVSIGVAPGTKGITGLNGWFWVTGLPLDGSFATSAPVLGATIDVQARPVSFLWNFGDGSKLSTTSPGVPYPGPDGPTAVHHVYQVMDESPGFQLSLTFVLSVRYQVNGGPWTDLGTVERTISVPYPVGEVVSSVASRS